MSMQARELETFLQSIGQVDVAQKAGDLAQELEDRKILKITPKVELPQGVRTETLKVGTLTKADFRARFEAMHITVPSSAQDLIDKVTLSTEEKPISLIFPTGRDLGLTARAPYREFLSAGQAKGYELCDPEVGLYLRIHDSKQPVNDVYWMAMEPIADRCGRPCVFALAHRSDGVWLDAYWAGSGRLWYPGNRLAFSLPASEPQKL